MKTQITVRHYGSTHFDINRWVTPANMNHAKPAGGLWTSPINSKETWAQAVEDIGLRRWDCTKFFDLEFTGNLLVIDSQETLENLPLRPTLFKLEGRPWMVDWERALKGFDGVWVPEGCWSLRRNEKVLFGEWDCETVWICNPKSFKLL